MIQYLSLFSGIGAFEKALKNLNIDFNLIGYSEIDKYADKAYSLIHGVPMSKNLGDITKIDERSIPLPVDLVTYGFPCQDISIAGGQQGLFHEDGSKTRSGLFFDALRIIEHTQPKIAIAENVKNLMCKRFEQQFQIVLQSLDEAGYNNYFKILDAKDYGIPQSRERVFIVSIRKDIDTGAFRFPDILEPKLRLIDLLEEQVDTKYFLSDKEITYMNREVKDGRNHWDFKHHSDITDDYCKCLTANMMKGVPYNVLRIGSVDLNGHDLCKRVYHPYGCSPTIPTGQSGNTIPKIPVGDVARKFTPKECFRLMGFEDSDWQVLVDNQISDSQLYKMAGNSIVVDVAEELLCMIFDSENEIYV